MCQIWQVCAWFSRFFTCMPRSRYLGSCLPCHDTHIHVPGCTTYVCAYGGCWLCVSSVHLACYDGGVHVVHALCEGGWGAEPVLGSMRQSLLPPYGPTQCCSSCSCCYCYCCCCCCCSLDWACEAMRHARSHTRAHSSQRSMSSSSKRCCCCMRVSVRAHAWMGGMHNNINNNRATSAQSAWCDGGGGGSCSGSVCWAPVCRSVSDRAQSTLLSTTLLIRTILLGRCCMRMQQCVCLSVCVCACIHMCMHAYKPTICLCFPFLKSLMLQLYVVPPLPTGLWRPHGVA
jgi:hypothetical protein